MHINKAGTLAVILLTFFIWGCSDKNDGSKIAEKKVENASLRLKWVYDPGFAGEMVSLKRGFFANEGVKLEIRPGGFEADPIKLVASGADTFGVAGGDSFLLALAKGVPIVAIAAGYMQTPVVYYSLDKSINSPKAMVGKKVGVQAGQDTETIYLAMLKKAGVNRASIKEVPVKYDFSPLLTGGVDVWPGYAATQSYMLKQQGKDYVVVKPLDYGISYIGTVYFTTREVFEKNPELVQAFVNGLLKGWEFTYSNEQAAIADIQSYDPKVFTNDLVKFNLDVQHEYIQPQGTSYGRYTPAQWASTVSTLKELNMLPADFKYDNAISYKFLDSYYSK